MTRSLVVFLHLVLACAPTPRPAQEYPPLEPESSGASNAESEPHTFTLSLVAINDVHGHLERMPHLAGFVNNVRSARESDGGAALFIDAGDMWQGTLASNMTEGAAMVAAFNAMGVDAAAIGNHEFDYGPVGDASTPQSDGDDRRGALIARAREAEFPILSANFRVAQTGEPVDWSPIRPSVLIERAGVKIGIIGLSTFETPETTISANVDDLQMAPLAEVARQEAQRLRSEGAGVVIITAHAGAHCESFDDSEDLSSCEMDGEIIQLAQALPEGSVDAIVGGHTHKAIAHRVNGIPVLEQYSYGYAFGRVDLTVDRNTGRVTASTIHPPHEVCQDRDVGFEGCEPGTYEGLPVRPDAAVARVVQPYMDAASERLAQSLNVTISARFARSRTEESSLGNLLADLMLEARDADLSILNGGGVRADFGQGPLSYGELYETFPFDNRFAFVQLTAGQLAELVAANLSSSAGTLIFGGVSVVAQCGAEGIEVSLRDSRGRRIPPNRRLRAVTSDYLALTPSFRALPDGAVEIEAGEPIREALAAKLRERGGTLDPGDYLREGRPRFQLPTTRPVRCP